VVFWILQPQQANIELESTPGLGTTFRVTLLTVDGITERRSKQSPDELVAYREHRSICVP
jgi:hypothetical protein